MMSAMSLSPLGLVTTWLTPIWILAVGAAAGLAILLGTYALTRWLRPSAADAMAATVRGGLLAPVAYLLVVLSIVAVLGAMVVPYRALWNSATRLFAVGPEEWTVTVPPTTGEHPIPLQFRSGELHAFELTSNRPLSVSTFVSFGATGSQGRFEVNPGQSAQWRRIGPLDKPYPVRVTRWLASNTGNQPAQLTIRARTDVEFPEVRSVGWIAAAVLGLFVALFAVRTFAPRVGAIAATTAKEASSQPLFAVLMALGAVALCLFIYLPYNTFGEDVKLVKSSGITLIMILSILVSVWSASVSVADEIEGHTALTLLSKPIRRWQFVIGKFLGTLGPVMVMFILLGALFAATVSYKVVYDARESSQSEPSWQLCYFHMASTLPGLALALMETVVLVAISVAISTRLPMVPNLVACATIYALGHLTPVLVQSAIGKNPIVLFVGQFIATIFPVLDYYSVEAAINQGLSVPAGYLAWSLLYSLLYGGVALVIALFLFEDRDLA